MCPYWYPVSWTKSNIISSSSDTVLWHWYERMMFERYWSEPLMTWAGLTFGDGLEPVFAWPETHDNQPKLFSILSSAHSNIGARDEPGEALSASSNQGLELNSSGQSEPGIMSHVLPRYWYYDLSSIYRDPIFIHDTNLLGSKLARIWCCPQKLTFHMIYLFG